MLPGILGNSLTRAPLVWTAFRGRFEAWWEGREFVAGAADEPTPDGESAPGRKVIGYRDPARPWETARVLLLQRLWGEGFALPGGPQHAAELVKPLALNPAMTVVDLSAGLGGGVRAMAESYGIWVDGLEQDRALAEAGTQLSIMAGLGKKAPVNVFDPDKYEFRPGSCDCVLARELLYRVADKKRLLLQMATALKHGGQLLLTDFVLREPGAAGSPAVEAWRKADPMRPSPWAVQDYTLGLAACKLETRISEDTTTAYRAMAMAGWAAFTKAAKGHRVDAEMAKCLASEVELFTRRMAALDSGDLMVYRIHALKQAGKMLSDW